MATAPKNNVRWASNLEKGPNYGATAPVSPNTSVVDPESPRMSNNNVSLPIGFPASRTRAQRRRQRKQRKQRKTRRNRRANRR